MTIWPPVLAFLVTLTLGISFSNNWFWSDLFAAFVAALAIRVFQVVLWAVSAGRKAFRLVSLLSITLPVALFFTPIMHLTRTAAFQTAFHRDPPAGISGGFDSLTYAGGPGDYVLVLYFHATPEAAREIFACVPFKPDVVMHSPEREEAAKDILAHAETWLGGDTMYLQHVFHAIRSIESPQFYKANVDYLFYRALYDPPTGTMIVECSR